MTHRRSWFVGAALLASLTAWALAPLGAQSSKGDFDSHLAAWDAHQALASTSPYKSASWSYLGPTNVSGRVTDVAVADHGTSRRLYAGSCCGGVWKSDDLGQTWQVVFDQAASTSTGALAVAPSNPDIVWIGTGESNIFRSSYAGVGVYKSTDNAKTWKHMGLTDTGTIGRIVVHPTNPDIVYVASAGHEWTENATRGVFKTTDGGRNWTKVLSISQKTGVNDVAMDPSDPNTLYAAAWERQRRHWNDPRPEPGFSEGGIFKTTDAGKTWTPLTNGLPPASTLGRVGVAVAASKPNVVYAFIDNYDIDTSAPTGARNPGGRGAGGVGIIRGAEVYRSDDKGATWRLVSGQDPAQRDFMRGVSATYGWVFGNVRVDPSDENTVYLLSYQAVASRDGGKTFGSILQTPPPTAAGAAGRGAGGGGRGATGSPGGDNHAFWIDPKDPKFLLSGNDSGFRVTTDGGATWKRADLQISTWFDIAYDMDTPFHVVGSVQDHGSYRLAVDLRNGRDHLNAVATDSAAGGIGGEYCEHKIDPTNPNIIYSEKVTRTDLSVTAPPRGGGPPTPNAAGAAASAGPQRSKNVRPPTGPTDDPFRMQVLAPLLLSPFDPNTIYFGAQYLFRSHDRGDTWEKLTGDLSGNDKTQRGDIPYQDVISISESPKKKGLLYAGTDDGRLHTSMDDGKTWTELTSGLPRKQWVAKVLASQYDESTVFLAQQGRYDDDFAVHLYKSTDYGKTWKSIAGNLPGGPINMIREDPVKANVLYACNDFGVYVSTNGGQKWDVLGGNLPSVNVMDFVVHPRDHVLVAATHGRGVWVIDVSGIEK
jgi:photosystem II stability/assembly factor-like uncharacterized protein